MRALPLMLLTVAAAGALGACDTRHRGPTSTATTTVDGDGKVTTTTTTTATGTTATATSAAGAEAAKGISGINIDTDKFKANIQIPGFTYGEGVDLDGMKLYPGSKIRGIQVEATDKGGTEVGAVTMAFSSPAAPAAVAAHLTAEAKKAGFAVTEATDTGLTGTKTDGGDGHRFTVALTPDGAATTGQMVLTGAKDGTAW